jgi:hypothetical protein
MHERVRLLLLPSLTLCLLAPLAGCDGSAAPPDASGDGSIRAIDGGPVGDEDAAVDAGLCESDADGDGVCDVDDVCPGGDDTIDADMDGRPDACDECPGEDDGADADGDGTPDCLDECPDDPDKNEPGICGCGVADSDADADGDGTPDCLDGCPDDPAKVEAGACGCGVADTDADADGTADCDDGCPDDPMKVAPGVCGCGVADADSDADGTLDCDDGCPDDPDKTAAGICGCGVADADTDADGVADCLDVCPGGDDAIDGDGDSVPDACDVCPGVSDPGQADTDGDGLGDACDDNGPGAGDLRVTELMARPAAVGDANGEWFELVNVSGRALDLAGLTVRDDGGETVTIVGATPLPAGGRFVIGRNADPRTNGGVPVDFEAPSFELSDAADAIVLEAGGVEIDRVAWDTGAGWTIEAGRSATFDEASPIADNADPFFWCLGASAYGAGNLGTPGEANDACEICGDALTVGAEACDIGFRPAGPGEPCSRDAECGASAPLCFEGVCTTRRCPATPGDEVCDGIDNDCNGTVDDGCALECSREDVPILDVDAPGACNATCSAPLDEQLYVPCGATLVTWGSAYYAGPATIAGTLRVRPESGTLPDAGQVAITATDVDVTGLVDGSGRGFRAGRGPGAGRPCDGSVGAGFGAGYGGDGGHPGESSCDSANRGVAYGDAATATIARGSGGATGRGGGASSPGGRGGAAVTLAAPTVRVAGEIRCDGENGSGGFASGGGGSGGGILLLAGTSLIVEPGAVVSADGGRGGGGDFFAGGGGAGGRVKLFSPSRIVSGTVTAAGGAGGASSFNGSAGGAGSLTSGPIP